MGTKDQGGFKSAEEAAAAEQFNKENRENQPVVKFEILPGRILKPGEDYAGQPAAYFVRTEGTKDTLRMTPGSIEEMLAELCGPETSDFISGMNSPESMREAAEGLKKKLSNPEMQRKIRTLYAEREKLKAELIG